MASTQFPRSGLMISAVLAPSTRFRTYASLLGPGKRPPIPPSMFIDTSRSYHVPGIHTGAQIDGWKNMSAARSSYCSYLVHVIITPEVTDVIHAQGARDRTNLWQWDFTNIDGNHWLTEVERSKSRSPRTRDSTVWGLYNANGYTCQFLQITSQTQVGYQRKTGGCSHQSLESVSRSDLADLIFCTVSYSFTCLSSKV
jgi:hypothetical protein